MNCCICGRQCWHVEFGGGVNILCLVFISILVWGFMPYGIYSVPLLVLCTSHIIHVVPMMLYFLAYCELLFFSLMGITVYSCNQILQICGCRLIGEE